MGDEGSSSRAGKGTGPPGSVAAGAPSPSAPESSPRAAFFSFLNAFFSFFSSFFIFFFSFAVSLFAAALPPRERGAAFSSPSSRGRSPSSPSLTTCLAALACFCCLAPFVAAPSGFLSGNSPKFCPRPKVLVVFMRLMACCSISNCLSSALSLSSLDDSSLSCSSFLRPSVMDFILASMSPFFCLKWSCSPRAVSMMSSQ
mmetsp:Transcript_130126/g.243391  ORF Transcript_130126/g.243391 Transcript_130126/m.243391 type:complete len:200 (-) Transcript_130126:3377-3976(-)